MSKSMFNYTGKTALITGASSGIGESFARELAARGMNVVIVARSEAKLRLLAQELSQRHNIQAEAIAIDLSQEKATRIVQEAVQQYGLAVDLLINNAASFTFALFEQSDSLENHQVYAAAKAFVLSFSEALLFEYRDRGVRVMALCPGPTRTSLLETSLIDPEQAASPEQVALAGLRALD